MLGRVCGVGKESGSRYFWLMFLCVEGSGLVIIGVAEEKRLGSDVTQTNRCHGQPHPCPSRPRHVRLATRNAMISNVRRAPYQNILPGFGSDPLQTRSFEPQIYSNVPPRLRPTSTSCITHTNDMLKWAFDCHDLLQRCMRISAIVWHLSTPANHTKGATLTRWNLVGRGASRQEVDHTSSILGLFSTVDK
jgi:hypothetical protein